MVSRALLLGWPIVPPSIAFVYTNVPADALLLNGQPITLNGQYITLARL